MRFMKGHYADKCPNNRKSDTMTEELTGDDAEADVETDLYAMPTGKAQFMLR